MTIRARSFLCVLFAGLCWFPTTSSAAETATDPQATAFVPIDAEALIGACAAMATESAESLAADKERRRKINYVKCLREAILEQYSGVIASHLSFAERDGADMEEKRGYWEGRAEWIADETRSCIPSCRPIEHVRSMLDHAAKVGEAVLRDLVAEHNVYAGGDKDFSQSADANALSESCWNLSDNSRGTGVTGLMRWSTLRTAKCFEHVILDQIEVMFESRGLSRQYMRKKIDNMRQYYGSFLAYPVYTHTH